MKVSKKEKVNIARRRPGLVITPPKPKPIEANHPARLLLRDAIEVAKANAEPLPYPHLGPASYEAERSDVQSAESSLQKDDANESQIHYEAAASEDSPDVARFPSRGESTADIPFDSHQYESFLTIARSQHEEFSAGSNITFEDFENSFRKRLSKSQLRICKVLFRMTYAIGATSCLIRVNDLMEQAQVKRRNLFLSLKELEKAGFIERGDIYNTPTKRGMKISFYPAPRIRKTPALRTFHYIDDVV